MMVNYIQLESGLMAGSRPDVARSAARGLSAESPRGALENAYEYSHRDYERELENFYNPDERAIDSIGEYVNNGYVRINGELRSNDLSDRTERDAYNISRSIQKYGMTAKEHIIVYRGQGKSLPQDQAFEHGGFMSTSTDKKVAEQFGENPMKIIVPPGAKYIPGAPDEFEFIFDAGTKLEPLGDGSYLMVPPKVDPKDYEYAYDD